MQFKLWLENQGIEGFSVYQNMTEIPVQELIKEYREEIAPAIQDGSSNLRWGIAPQEAQRIFGDENKFVQLAQASQPQTLPPSVLRNVRNYGQITNIIDNYLNNPQHSSEIELPQQQQFFQSIDPSTGTGPQGNQQSNAEIERQKTGGYTKLSSYQHKIDLIQGNESVVYPLLLNYKGSYSHISGATRQTAAVTKKIILPVKVISA